MEQLAQSWRHSSPSIVGSVGGKRAEWVVAVWKPSGRDLSPDEFAELEELVKEVRRLRKEVIFLGIGWESLGGKLARLGREIWGLSDQMGWRKGFRSWGG